MTLRVTNLSTGEYYFSNFEGLDKRIRLVGAFLHVVSCMTLENHSTEESAGCEFIQVRLARAMVQQPLGSHDH
jgi:ABC-type hemin transport system ATPase subunit